MKTLDCALALYFTNRRGACLLRPRGIGQVQGAASSAPMPKRAASSTHTFCVDAYKYYRYVVLVGPGLAVGLIGKLV